MRGYAVLLGTILTVGYGYAAQVAVNADHVAGAGRSTEHRAGQPVRSPDDTVWYGGTLEPIVVEAAGGTGSVRAPAKEAATACAVPEGPRGAGAAPNRALPTGHERGKLVVKAET